MSEVTVQRSEQLEPWKVIAMAFGAGVAVPLALGAVIAALLHTLGAR